jgi:hypothetical protein
MAMGSVGRAGKGLLNSAQRAKVRNFRSRRGPSSQRRSGFIRDIRRRRSRVRASSISRRLSRFNRLV